MLILGISDGRSGHDSHIRGLCYELSKHNYKIILHKVTYPSLLKIFPMMIREKLLTHTLPKDFPNVVVAVGNRTLPYVKFLKTYAKIQGKDLKVIYLMPPTSYYIGSYIDVCFFHKYKTPKVICSNMQSVLLPSQGLILDGQLLTKNNNNNKQLFLKSYCNKNDANITGKEIVGVLIGGNTKGVYYSTKAIIRFIKDLENFAKFTKKSTLFLITTTRRTPRRFADIVNKLQPKIDYILVSYQEKEAKDFYSNVILYSDVIIITGDSVSMLAEVCASQVARYIYVYTSNLLKMKRFSKLHEMLYNDNLALPFLSYKDNKNELQSRKIINNNKCISDIIIESINNN